MMSLMTGCLTDRGMTISNNCQTDPPIKMYGNIANAVIDLCQSEKYSECVDQSAKDHWYNLEKHNAIWENECG